MIKETGNIKPTIMNDLEFFFEDGVFRHKHVATLTNGMMFGELGILMNKPRSATIVA